MQSAKCDFQMVTASSKCDFRVLTEDVSFGRRTVNLAGGIGFLHASSSKCDFKLTVNDHLDRFSLSARVAGSSKCDFSVVVDLGITGGSLVRLSGGGSSKCDFVLSRLDAVSNPPVKK